MQKEKPNLDTKRINLNVSEETKERWDKFVENSKFTTLSQLVRESVDHYLNASSKMEELNRLESYLHNLKENLSSIKLASQMLIEEFKEKLSFKDLKSINLIYEKSLNIEKILNKVFNVDQTDKEPYDVIIVDDDDATIYLLSDFFKKKGIKTKTTSSGKETLEIIQYSKPKLILLDILLLNDNGYEICRKIRSNDTLKTIPVYYITAVPKIDVDEKTKETGADGYILKPFDMLEFENLIKKYKLSQEV